MPDNNGELTMEKIIRTIGFKYQLIFISFILGIIGFFVVIGPIEFVLNFFKQQFSDFIWVYNPALSVIEFYQQIFLVLVGSLLIGFIASRLLNSIIANKTEMIVSGFFFRGGNIHPVTYFNKKFLVQFFLCFYTSRIPLGWVNVIFKLLNVFILFGCIIAFQIYGAYRQFGMRDDSV